MARISKILIVDDEEAEHLIAKAAILKYDPSIIMLSAYDGAEALKILQQPDPPEVVLLDICMPGMDGHGFLRHYAAGERPAAIIAMLTSSQFSKDERRCLDYNFVKKYIVKPLSTEDLADIAVYLDTDAAREGDRPAPK